MHHRPLLSMVVRISASVAIAMIAIVTPAAARELASAAIAAAVDNGTFDEVRQAIAMDMNLQQRFELDEDGIEAVGRSLLGQEGRSATAIEVLQFNQMIHGDSAPAAIALADALVATGNPMAARMYYQRALEIDPANSHARQAIARLGGDTAAESGGSMAAMGIDPAMLAAAGVTPEQLRQMEQAMAQAGQMAAGGGRPASAPKEQSAPSPSGTSRSARASEPAVTYESEFCEVLHRYNSEKKIADAAVRDRYAGEYGGAGDAERLRTWNVETTCGEFLVAVPLWADVSPPILDHLGGHRFQDANGATWEFQMSGDGTSKGVTMIAADGTVTGMNRLGDPRRLR